MADEFPVALYLARRDAYAAFLAAVDAETPVAEARAPVERAAALHRDGGREPDWYEVKKARAEFLAAATGHLRSVRGEGRPGAA
ncbi:hypothetical protein RKE29_09720 [Streptomyces sp. B1866]|uniref:hypothetical protein n=1 Tax=Streptomyces sp. B1866 TaxID=3075431 RepID=UPI00288EC629|nr:hypothetical protein [Streptomyces sp. B1866]MDT3396919.1 hypothetical protein [Streptomyces sp. B1866]